MAYFISFIYTEVTIQI